MNVLTKILKKLRKNFESEDEILIEMRKKTVMNLRYLNIAVIFIISCFFYIDKMLIEDFTVYQTTNILRLVFLFTFEVPLLWITFKDEAQKFTQSLLIFNALGLGLFLTTLSFIVKEYPVALFHNTVSIFLLNISLYVVFGIRIRYALILSFFFLILMNLNYYHFYAPVGQVAINFWFIIVTIVGIVVTNSMSTLFKKVIQMNAELKKANQSKYKLFSMVSHDLKNLIAVQYTIANYLKDAEQSSKIDDRQRMVDLLNHSAEEILNVFEDLMAWIKTQIDVIHPSFQKIDVDKFHQTLENQMYTLLESKQMELRLHSEGFFNMSSDANILGLILRNIVGNSIKFSIPGSSIQLNHFVDKESFRYQVIDTGIGMSEEELSRLFNPEQVYTNKGTHGEKGTGLGLLLTKELVTLLHGTVSIDSTPGKGTCVTMIFPNHNPSEVRLQPKPVNG